MSATPAKPNPPPHRELRSKIAWALAFKILALATFYFACFGPSHRPAVSADAVAARLAGSVPVHGKP